MPAYPINDLTNVNLDQASDDPSQARAELNALVIKVQEMLDATGTTANHVLKLDSNGDVPTGVGLADAIAILDGGTGSTTASGARSNLGVDASGTDNSTDVTLIGTPNYITLGANQVITLGQVDLAADVSGVLPAGNIGTNAVTTAKINALAVTTAKIAALAITTAKIAALAVTSAELAASSVTRSKLSTATVSTAGAISGVVIIDLALNGYAFFPMIHILANRRVVTLTGHVTDAADPDSPRFAITSSDVKSSTSYDMDYRYIQA